MTGPLIQNGRPTKWSTPLSHHRGTITVSLRSFLFSFLNSLAHCYGSVYSKASERRTVGAGEKEHQFRRFDEQRSRRRGGGTTLKKIL